MGQPHGQNFLDTINNCDLKYLDVHRYHHDKWETNVFEITWLCTVKTFLAKCWTCFLLGRMAITTTSTIFDTRFPIFIPKLPTLSMPWTSDWLFAKCPQPTTHLFNYWILLQPLLHEINLHFTRTHSVHIPHAYIHMLIPHWYRGLHVFSNAHWCMLYADKKHY